MVEGISESALLALAKEAALLGGREIKSKSKGKRD